MMMGGKRDGVLAPGGTAATALGKTFSLIVVARDVLGCGRFRIEGYAERLNTMLGRHCHVAVNVVGLGLIIGQRFRFGFSRTISILGLCELLPARKTQEIDFKWLSIYFPSTPCSPTTQGHSM